MIVAQKAWGKTQIIREVFDLLLTHQAQHQGELLVYQRIIRS